jgi:hypothetical protein
MTHSPCPVSAIAHLTRSGASSGGRRGAVGVRMAACRTALAWRLILLGGHGSGNPLRHKRWGLGARRHRRLVVQLSPHQRGRGSLGHLLAAESTHLGSVAEAPLGESSVPRARRSACDRDRCLVRRSVVDEPYGDEGIAPALLAAEDALVAFVVFGGQTDPTAPGPSSSSVGGIYYSSSRMGLHDSVASCCAASGADEPRRRRREDGAVA